MEHYTFSVVQRAATAAAALATARHGSYLTDGIHRKTQVRVVQDRAVTLSQAEDIAQTWLTSSDGSTPYTDPDSPVVGAIPVADRAGKPSIAWLLFGTAPRATG
jgi:hypothetical protein